MQQFTVPQFIDVEDKIIGPITVRQFIIIIIGGLLLFLEYKLSDITFFIFIGILTAAFFGVIAFAKVNGMPFHFFILNIIQTLKRPNLRVWARQESTVNEKNKTKIPETVQSSKPIPKKKPITSSRLSDLSLIIDTGGLYAGQNNLENSENNSTYDQK